LSKEKITTTHSPLLSKEKMADSALVLYKMNHPARYVPYFFLKKQQKRMHLCISLSLSGPEFSVFEIRKQCLVQVWRLRGGGKRQEEEDCGMGCLGMWWIPSFSSTGMCVCGEGRERNCLIFF
jgi:hypothetical protein